MKVKICIENGVQGEKFFLEGKSLHVFQEIMNQIDETVTEVSIKKEQHTEEAVCCNN